MEIRLIREKSGMTQLELANRIGIDRSTIAKWESGVSLPRANLLPKLASILGCTVDELLRTDNPAPVAERPA